MNIGIDIDGVIFDSERLFRIHSEEYSKSIHKPKIKDDEIKAQERYGWTNDETKHFIETYFGKIQAETSIMEGAKEAIDALREKHTIYIISARGYRFEDEIDYTHQYLNKFEVHYDHIVFKQESKVDACRNLDIDVMIDDNYHVLNELHDHKIKCIYLRDPQNKKAHAGIPEVYSWKEVLPLIEQISEKLKK